MNTLKNYLRTHRKKLGLSQRQLAVILGLKSSTRISEMELGCSLPSARECVAFRRLFKKSFDELWPRVTFEVEVTTDSNTRRLIEELKQKRVRSTRRRNRLNIIRANLQIVVDDGDEDLTNAA